jgi:hypothetical protein
MDKRKALVDKIRLQGLSFPGFLPVVSLEDFFEGNEDSVDPNFDDHETSEVFKCGAKSTFWAPIWGKSRAKSPVVAPDQPLGGAVGPLHG